jgi:F0F1-type ATP synthase membrane subunit a
VVLLELGVAVIQAYVFAMLTASYIKDAELLH